MGRARLVRSFGEGLDARARTGGASSSNRRLLTSCWSISSARAACTSTVLVVVRETPPEKGTWLPTALFESTDQIAGGSWGGAKTCLTIARSALPVLIGEINMDHEMLRTVVCVGAEASAQIRQHFPALCVVEVARDQVDSYGGPCIAVVCDCASAGDARWRWRSGRTRRSSCRALPVMVKRLPMKIGSSARTLPLLVPSGCRNRSGPHRDLRRHRGGGQNITTGEHRRRSR